MTSEAMVAFLPFPPLLLPPDLPLPSTVGARWALCGRQGFSAKKGGGGGNLVSWTLWLHVLCSDPQFRSCTGETGGVITAPGALKVGLLCGNRGVECDD